MPGTQLMLASDHRDTAHMSATVQYVTMRVGDAMVGISVHSVQDVIRYQPITPVPLTEEVVAGALNVRGRVVTAIDLRKRLCLGAYPNLDSIMMVVVEYQQELYAMMVDAVGDVLTLESAQQESLPGNMDEAWRSAASGVYKLDDDLLVIIDVANVIDYLAKGHAA